MQGKWNRRADFTRICCECANYEENRSFAVCTVPRDIVTGNPLRVECRSARSMVGHCGPEGRHFVVRGTVSTEDSKVTRLDARRKGGKQ